MTYNFQPDKDRCYEAIIQKYKIDITKDNHSSYFILKYVIYKQLLIINIFPFLLLI